MIKDEMSLFPIASPPETHYKCSQSIPIIYIQGSSNECFLGCVNSRPAAKRSQDSCNLGTLLQPSLVYAQASEDSPGNVFDVYIRIILTRTVGRSTDCTCNRRWAGVLYFPTGITSSCCFSVHNANALLQSHCCPALSQLRVCSGTGNFPPFSSH